MVRENKQKHDYYSENYIKTLQVFPNILELPEGIHVFKSKGFMDLILHILKKDKNQTWLDILHYFNQENKNGYQMCYPDPKIETLINHKEKTITAFSFMNTVAVTNIYDNSGGEILTKKEDLNSFLSQWLMNLSYQGHKEVPNAFEWKRFKQERNENYFFRGFVRLTTGVMDELPPEQLFYILLDVQGFAKINDGCDYLQIFENSGQKIYCIDQLSKEMLEGDNYTEEEKKEYNYFTVMFNYEY